jgi:hypothetical protein
MSSEAVAHANGCEADQNPPLPTRPRGKAPQQLAQRVAHPVVRGPVGNEEATLARHHPPPSTTLRSCACSSAFSWAPLTTRTHRWGRRDMPRGATAGGSGAPDVRCRHPPHWGRRRHRVGLMGERTRWLVCTSTGETLASNHKGSRRQLKKALLLVQQNRRHVDCGEPMARRQKHVFNSANLPRNDVGGLGWENIPGLRPRRGRGHRQGIILAKPRGLGDESVMRVLRITMRYIPRPLGEDTGERKDVSRKGQVLWVDGVDGHHIDVRVPEASPLEPHLYKEQEEGVGTAAPEPPPPSSRSQHPTGCRPTGEHPVGGEGPTGTSATPGLGGVSPETPAAEGLGGGGDEPPSSTASSSLSKFRNLGSTVAKAWSSLRNSGPNTAKGSGRDSRRGDGSWGGVPPQPLQMMRQPWPGLPRGRPPYRRTSRMRSVVTMTAPGREGLPAYAYACGACVKAKW